MSAKETDSRKYELVAPDGGWGYMIGLGVIINLVTLVGFMNSFGMLYKDLFIEINMDSTSVTLFSGIAAFSIAMSGFVARALQAFMSLRQLGLAAAFVFNFGVFGTVYAKSKLLFFIFQGIFQGMGNGLLYNLTCTVLNDYFVKRRLLAFSLTQTIAAVFSLLLPQFVEWSIEKYGSQGTLLLVSAISMHNFFGTALMQPVAWHMKKVEVYEPKEKVAYGGGSIMVWAGICLGARTDLVVFDRGSLTADRYIREVLEENVVPFAPYIETKLLLADAKELEANKNNFTYNEKLDKSEHVTDIKHDSKIKIFFSQFIDFSLLKSFGLSNACIGVAFSGFLDCTFIMWLPQALYSMGWNESEVAKALSLNALGDLITRIVVILMNNVLTKTGSHEIFVAGLVIAFVARIGMLWSDNHTSVLTFLTIIGLSRCTIGLFIPVVVADSVGQEKFTSAMGVLQIVFGFFYCTVGPAIGVIRDLTDSYTAAFYVLTSGFGVVVISWSIELLYKKTMRSKSPKIDTALKQYDN